MVSIDIGTLHFVGEAAGEMDVVIRLWQTLCNDSVQSVFITRFIVCSEIIRWLLLIHGVITIDGISSLSRLDN